jgi:hypothetical protein
LAAGEAGEESAGDDGLELARVAGEHHLRPDVLGGVEEAGKLL